MKKLAFFLTLILLTTSCTQLRSFFSFSPISKPEVKQEIALPKIPDFPVMPIPYNDVIYPLDEHGIVVDCESHIQDIKNILGEPDTVNVEELTNPHLPSQIDEIDELFYKGLNISVYVFEQKHLMDDTSIIVGFTLTGQQYYLPGNIKIGSSLIQVKTQIRPLIRKKNYFLYNNLFEEEGYQETIRFYFAKDKLSKVVWYCAIN